MVHARINQGQVELQDPIPAAWDGQIVKLVPLTPEDPNPNLEQQLAALHALGPMEFEPGEREEITAALADLDQLSKDAMVRLPSDSRRNVICSIRITYRHTSTVNQGWSKR